MKGPICRLGIGVEETDLVGRATSVFARSAAKRNDKAISKYNMRDVFCGIASAIRSDFLSKLVFG